MKPKIVIRTLGGLAVLLTIVPLFAADYWWIRMFDFPHTQLTLLTLFALIVYIWRFDVERRGDYVFVAILAISFIFQMTKIFPYLPFANETVEDTKNKDERRMLALYAANVLQDNEKEFHAQQLLDSTDADIILFMETNRRWIDSLKGFKDKFPYSVEVPKENTYGMYLVSRLELIDPRIYTLVDDSIPSIDTKVLLRSGDTLQLFCLHPTPPMPQENPTSTSRDAELMLYAEMSRKADLPVVVMGDFNDVPWSATTELFKTYSGLLDPRKGRALLNTYKVGNYLLRWPLDHIFVSPEFRIRSMQRGPDIGSDHFPLRVRLSYDPEGWKEQEPPAPSDATVKQAHQIIDQAELDLSNENLRYKPNE